MFNNSFPSTTDVLCPVIMAGPALSLCEGWPLLSQLPKLGSSLAKEGVAPHRYQEVCVCEISCVQNHAFLPSSEMAFTVSGSVKHLQEEANEKVAPALHGVSFENSQL